MEDIVVLIIGGLVSALVASLIVIPIVLIIIWRKTKRIIKKIPEDMMQRIQQDKINTKEVENARKERYEGRQAEEADRRDEDGERDTTGTVEDSGSEEKPDEPRVQVSDTVDARKSKPAFKLYKPANLR